MAFGDIVQTAVNNAATGTTISATFAGAVTAGNLIVAVAFSGDGPLTVSGDLIEGINHHDTGSDDGFSLGYRVVAGGDGTTWGFTQPTSDQWAIIIREIEGPWEASPLDQTGTTAFADSSDTGAMIATVGGATSQNDEVAIAAWGFRDSTSGDTITLDTVSDSFVSLLQEDDSAGSFQKSVGIAQKVLTTIGTPASTGTFSNQSTWRRGALMATFKKSAGGEEGGLPFITRISVRRI